MERVLLHSPEAELHWRNNAVAPPINCATILIKKYMKQQQAHKQTHYMHTNTFTQLCSFRQHLFICRSKFLPTCFMHYTHIHINEQVAYEQNMYPIHVFQIINLCAWQIVKPTGVQRATHCHLNAIYATPTDFDSMIIVFSSLLLASIFACAILAVYAHTSTYIHHTTMFICVRRRLLVCTLCCCANLPPKCWCQSAC